MGNKLPLRVQVERSDPQVAVVGNIHPAAAAVYQVALMDTNPWSLVRVERTEVLGT